MTTVHAPVARAAAALRRRLPVTVVLPHSIALWLGRALRCRGVGGGAIVPANYLACGMPGLPQVLDCSHWERALCDPGDTGTLATLLADVTVLPDAQNALLLAANLTARLKRLSAACSAILAECPWHPSVWLAAGAGNSIAVTGAVFMLQLLDRFFSGCPWQRTQFGVAASREFVTRSPAMRRERAPPRVSRVG
jgi:hypothetical protein